MIAACGGNADLIERLQTFKAEARAEQEAKAAKLESLGADAYLAQKGGAMSKTVM